MHQLALVRLICWVSDHPGQTTLESTAIFSLSQLRQDSFCLKPHSFYFLPLWEAAAALRQGRGDSGAAAAQPQTAQPAWGWVSHLKHSVTVMMRRHEFSVSKLLNFPEQVGDCNNNKSFVTTIRASS